VRHRATAVPVYLAAPTLSTALPARPHRSRDRPFHTVHRIVERMHRPRSLPHHLWRSGPLHRAYRMHSPADTTRHKQPGQEPHFMASPEDDGQPLYYSVKQTREPAKTFT